MWVSLEYLGGAGFRVRVVVFRVWVWGGNPVVLGSLGCSRGGQVRTWFLGDTLKQSRVLV